MAVFPEDIPEELDPVGPPLDSQALLHSYQEFTQDRYQHALDKLDTMRDPQAKERFSSEIDRAIREAMVEMGRELPDEAVKLRALPDRSVLLAASDMARAVDEIEIFLDTYSVVLPRGASVKSLAKFYEKEGVDHAWRYLQYRYHDGPPPEYGDRQLDDLSAQAILEAAAEADAGAEGAAVRGGLPAEAAEAAETEAEEVASALAESLEEDAAAACCAPDSDACAAFDAGPAPEAGIEACDAAADSAAEADAVVSLV
eukprot:tig00000498_g1674.t1